MQLTQDKLPERIQKLRDEAMTSKQHAVSFLIGGVAVSLVGVGLELLNQPKWAAVSAFLAGVAYVGSLQSNQDFSSASQQAATYEAALLNSGQPKPEQLSE